LEAIGRLAGGISHVFNNQMCIIQLHCEQLLDLPELPESMRSSLNRISKAGERTSDITARLSQFARSKALKNSNFNMTTWLEAICGDLKRALGDSIELQIESTSAETIVFADAYQLGGVLLNLARNARQAMATGGKWTLLTERIHLTEAGLGRELRLSPGDYIRLSATDTGCGMDEETVKRIFEPFYSTKSLAVAEGLGLASAFGLLQQSGGKMTASSKLGKGTTLRLYLPVAASV
jgi:signal transduction histidine kinase